MFSSLLPFRTSTSQPPSVTTDTSPPSQSHPQYRSSSSSAPPSSSLSPTSTSTSTSATGATRKTPTSPPTSTSTRSNAQPTPQISNQRQIDEARNAVVASIGNMLDRELSGRAALLHANNTAIEKQERDVSKAVEGLKRENDRLAKLAGEHAKKVKEIGNVQNWAEMLEREFLIIEETLRLANGGGSDGGSECGSDCSCGRSEDGEENDRGVRPERVPLPEAVGDGL
ncbi:hypothetical protein OQA88_5028 [Cercophora sp. LCS_1]